MGFMDFFPGTRRQAQLENLAERIASDCQVAVWDRVSHKLAGMAPNEARGYVRARAALLVETSLQNVLQNAAQWLVAAADRLKDLANDAVVRRAISAMISQRNQRQATRRAA